MTAPAIVVAAPTSGGRASEVANALMRGLSETFRVAPFVAGPQLVDAAERAAITGRPVRSLDQILCGEARIVPLYRYGSAGADIAVIDGVEGIFDGSVAGSGGAGVGSVADIAQTLSAPVILVVDVRGYGQSVAALLAGFIGFRPSISIAAVVVDGVADAAHEAVLREACAQVGVEIVGTIPDCASVVAPDEFLAMELIRKLAVGPAPGPAWNPEAEVQVVDSGTVALAGGPAFDGGHPEYEELLLAAGATVCRFDPRIDELPANCSALILPHGQVDSYVGELSDNGAARHAIRAFADAGGVIHAQGSAAAYLTRAVDGAPMCDVLPAVATRSASAPAYRDAAALADSALFAMGERVAGYADVTLVVAAGVQPAWGWRDADGTVLDGHVTARVHASSLQLHPAGHPAFVGRLLVDAS